MKREKNRTFTKNPFLFHKFLLDLCKKINLKYQLADALLFFFLPNLSERDRTIYFISQLILIERNLGIKPIKLCHEGIPDNRKERQGFYVEGGE